MQTTTKQNSISAALLPEFDSEMTATRRMLERIPDDKLDWRPHTKSMTLSELVTHVANTPEWVVYTFASTELDFAPAEGKGWVPPTPGNRAHTLAMFDTNVKSARAALVAANDADMRVVWSLKSGGQVILAQPRAEIVRSFVMNHLIHHRGQLSVYLRLLDVPVPSVYGPTADEGS